VAELKHQLSVGYKPAAAAREKKPADQPGKAKRSAVKTSVSNPALAKVVTKKTDSVSKPRAKPLAKSSARKRK
jgi:hypothetical protein